ncbi:diguanylate phosphodiesterase [Mycobacterium sp. E802]|nr:diguanylate phosphodiesterase [Mycobacterium sp. E802]
MASHLPTWRPVLVVGVLVAAGVNALALWGPGVAYRGEAVLQLCTGLVAVVCGVVVAARMSGAARWWRLLYVAAVLMWLVGQVLWWTHGAGPVPSAMKVSYLVLPALITASLGLLVYSSGGLPTPREDPLRRTFATNLLDGTVAGASFLILAAMGDFGTHSTASLPRSGVPTLDVIFAVAEVLLVAAAVVVAMVYEPGRPYRTNYLLLAGGLITMAASDRIVAYFRSVGAAGGDLWGGIGLVVGPVIIAFAMLEQTPPEVCDDTDRGIDWARLVLPYIGFLGIAVLFAYHVMIGQPLDPFVVWATVAMVLLVTVRQILAMRSQHLLTQQLYRAQRRLGHQVYHDALTGLPNRLLFRERLDEAMKRGQFVLIFIDLDDFKEVNDRFGHAAGDELLCTVGDRLKRCISDADTLARIGGDEFAVLIEGESGNPEVAADRLRVALRDPFPVHGSSVRVKASMGLVPSGAGGPEQTSDDVLRQADISMYAGKRLGKNTAVVYQPESDTQVDFPTVLRAAAGVPDGFSLAYQPVVDLTDGTLVAVEALARWTAPNGLQISPETFVAMAEGAGLGATFDAMVLDLACQEVVASGLQVDLHVNIGAARLGNTGFDEQVRRVLERHRLPGHRLVVEITETLPILDLTAAAAQIERLNAIGVKVALDDFGAGYNSLTYLHALPVQIVKLDRSLAVDAEPERDLTLYRSVIGLCSDLGFSVIAEGIESTLQAGTILAAGCQLAQGHLFGRATPLSDISVRWADAVRQDAEYSNVGRG